MLILLIVLCLAHLSVGSLAALTEDVLVVEITGEEHHWYFRYPGQDGTIDTADDIVRQGDLHVPVDVQVLLQLKSRDYIYTFSLPHIDQTKVAVPEMVFTLDFVPERLGTFVFKGDQMCGFKHDTLKGKLIVEAQADFLAWLADQEAAK